MPGIVFRRILVVAILQRMNCAFAFCKKKWGREEGHLAAGHYVNFHHIGHHKWDRGLGQTFLGQTLNFKNQNKVIVSAYIFDSTIGKGLQ